jgi:hypothetical protein
MVHGKDKDYLRNDKGNIANNLLFSSLNRTFAIKNVTK